MTGNRFQLADPILGQVIVRMQDGTFGQCPYKLTHPPEILQLLQECNHLKLRQGHPCAEMFVKETLIQLVLKAAHWETTLRGCHDEIGHLDLKRMLDPDAQPFLLASNGCTGEEACQEMQPVCPFKVKQQRSPMESIVATHPLEVVHINYLCLEPGKGTKKTSW